MTIVGKRPGFVKSYDPDSRMCTVSIPGITDGASEFPEAEIEYPIGDKSAASAVHTTELEILEGDPVWLEFENGDERFPIITGYRNPRSGNSSAWRRYHHANIEVNADQQVLIIAGDNCTVQTKNAIVQASVSTTIESPTTTVTGTLTVQGLLTFEAGMQGSGGPEGGATMNITGNMNLDGTITNNDVNIGSTHKHKENGAGSLTDDPQ